ncbi:MAG: virulence protein SciE type [Acidobacteria bacterium]|nr:virulence protein SciE type [Acidobacteriota bacterium]
MDAESLLKAGDLDGCLAALTERVRRDPADPKLRIFLFQVLAVRGDWKRALNQLAVLGEMHAGALGMVATYRSAIQCEALRADVFAGKRTPVVLGDPTPWIASLVEVLRMRAAEQHDAATELRDRAFEQAAETPGTLDGESFAWIADGDTRLGPVLEVIVDGRYAWAPFERIASLDISPPADLRDTVWAPVDITWSNGGQSVGFIPTRYAGTESAGDAGLLLARRTEWIEIAPGDFAGRGQRMLMTDAGEHALLDVRALHFASADAVPESHDG